MPQRIDSGRLDKGTPLPGGGLSFPAYPTRVGVFVYRTQDGQTIRELRPEEEVFDPESLKSLDRAPVTIGHPAKFVTPETWKEVSVGHVSGVKPENPFVGAEVAVNDARALSLVGTGDAAEVSCGYDCISDPTPGVWQGEKYDAIQRKIRYNHLSLLPRGAGRGGPKVALRLDGVGFQIENEDPPMEKITIDGVEYVRNSPEHVACLDAKIERERGRADANQARLDASTAELAKARDPKTFAAAVQSRAKLLSAMARLDDAGEAPAEAAGMSDLEMMAKMISKVSPAFDLKGKSDDYIRGAFAAIVEPALAKMAAENGAPEEPPAEPPAPPPPPGPALDGVNESRAITPKTGNVVAINAAAAAKKMREDSANAWQKPLAFSKDR